MLRAMMTFEIHCSRVVVYKRMSEKKIKVFAYINGDIWTFAWYKYENDGADSIYTTRIGCYPLIKNVITKLLKLIKIIIL